MLAGEAIYDEYEALAAIAYGLVATLPPEDDFYDEKTGPYLPGEVHHAEPQRLG